ncbi:C6 zinc finger domain containing protein [Colletotrichum chrysophilum]|uniref:C6 zinc finger domain containing protein n=1 Tax=Colletotrichum chrysophilum TaxID=1836956 RepID=A0AAD9EL18_9PEZI|nr:C6 zinc finger domain containing protein [Colletotrichum chrysophilum]
MTGVQENPNIQLILSATPENYTSPSTDLSAWFADVSWWFAFNMLHTEVPATKDQTPYYQASERFNKAVLLGPKEDCATESCKAVGYTGSQDLCGISKLAQLMTSWSADTINVRELSLRCETYLVPHFLRNNCIVSPAPWAAVTANSVAQPGISAVSTANSNSSINSPRFSTEAAGILISTRGGDCDQMTDQGLISAILNFLIWIL